MTRTVTQDGEVLYQDPPYQTKGTPAPFWKTPWNHDRDAESNATSFACHEPSKTQQQFAKDADINVILAKFLNTGELNLTGHPAYGVTPDETDLLDSIVTSSQVAEAWNALPAAVRNILKDPKTFADYVDHCVENGDLDPLRELGLANAKVPEPAIEPKATPAPAEPEKAV